MNNRRTFIKNAGAGIFGISNLHYTFNNSSENSATILKKISKSKNDNEIISILRNQLLLEPGLTYLNTGSIGPTPKYIVEFVLSKLYELEKNPVLNTWGKLGNEMEGVREIVASFLNTDIDEIVLTRNATDGMNLICSSIDLEKGDEVLTTNYEHPGTLAGWKYLENKIGIKIIQMEMPIPVLNKTQILNLIEKSISNHTRVLVLSEISFITGLKMPLEEISKLLRDKNILFICDATQAVGMVQTDVKNIGVDIYLTSGHKWLLAPKETGIIYIKKEINNRIKSIFLFNGNKTYTASTGTRNIPNILGLGKAIELQNIIGKKRIENRCVFLKNYLQRKLSSFDEISIISSNDPELSATGILCASLNFKANHKVYEELLKRKILVKPIPFFNGLRFSTHFFNTVEEIDKLYFNLIEIFKLPN